MAFITEKQRRKYGFTDDDYNYEIDHEQIAKYQIDLHNR